MGFFDDDDKNNERFRNFLLFKIWGTDDDVEEYKPTLFIISIIGIVVIVLVLIFAL